jgi:hypothetical protein
MWDNSKKLSGGEPYIDNNRTLKNTGTNYKVPPNSTEEEPVVIANIGVFSQLNTNRGLFAFAKYQQISVYPSSQLYR